MADSDKPHKVEIKLDALTKEKISEVNKILEQVLADKDKVTPKIFDLHVSL